MVKVFADAEMYHGYYEGDISVERITATIAVVCSSCKRLVYQKDLGEIPHSGG